MEWGEVWGSGWGKQVLRYAQDNKREGGGALPSRSIELMSSLFLIVVLFLRRPVLGGRRRVARRFLLAGRLRGGLRTIRLAGAWNIPHGLRRVAHDGLWHARGSRSG